MMTSANGTVFVCGTKGGTFKEVDFVTSDKAVAIDWDSATAHHWVSEVFLYVPCEQLELNTTLIVVDSDEHKLLHG